jgi:putative ABC transport system permease protein
MEIQPILLALRRSKTGAILVAAQVALTLAIVCNALFVVKARLATVDRPSGAAEDEVFQIQYAAAGEIEDRKGMQRADLEALRAIPGVKAVAAVNSFPVSTSGWGMGVTLDGKPGKEIPTGVYFSGESYVKALGLKLVAGRDFQESEVREVDDRTDSRVAADVVILSRHLARKLFGDEAKAIGKTIYQGSGPEANPMRVIGVVETLMNSSAPANDEFAQSTFIWPIRFLGATAHYAVRTDPSQRQRVMKDAEKALGALRPDRVLINLHDMQEIKHRRYRHERAGANMLIAVTIGLLLVTASGIVGVASLWVSQRRKQIGVRRALGARRRDIVRYFVTENLLITTAGIGAGLALAIGLNLFLVSKLELAKLPLAYLAGGMVAVWALGLLAVIGPAWRAAAVPPAIATRSA